MNGKTRMEVRGIAGSKEGLSGDERDRGRACIIGYSNIFGETNGVGSIFPCAEVDAEDECEHGDDEDEDTKADPALATRCTSVNDRLFRLL